MNQTDQQESEQNMQIRTKTRVAQSLPLSTYLLRGAISDCVAHQKCGFNPHIHVIIAHDAQKDGNETTIQHTLHGAQRETESTVRKGDFICGTTIRARLGVIPRNYGNAATERTLPNDEKAQVQGQHVPVKHTKTHALTQNTHCAEEEDRSRTWIQGWAFSISRHTDKM